MSRDCTLFRDDDGTAYFLSAARENADLILYRLSPDDLSIEEQVKTLWPGQAREAPCIMKRDGIYFLISSACTGWLPNQGMYAWADSLTGRWSPLKPLGDATTYDSQPAFIVPVTGTETGATSYLYVGDRWDPTNYFASSYVFLPLAFPSRTEMELAWADEIRIDAGSGTIEGECRPPTGLHRLKSVGTELYLTVKEYGSGRAVLQTKTLSYEDPSQLWRVVCGDGGRMGLQHEATKLWVSAEHFPVLAAVNAKAAGEHAWTLTETEDGVFIGKASSDEVWTVNGNEGTEEGHLSLQARVSHDPRQGRDPQRFQILPAR